MVRQDLTVHNGAPILSFFFLVALWLCKKKKKNKDPEVNGVYSVVDGWN
jgi:hypothetical protein